MFQSPFLITETLPISQIDLASQFFSRSAPLHLDCVSLLLCEQEAISAWQLFRIMDGSGTDFKATVFHFARRWITYIQLLPVLRAVTLLIRVITDFIPIKYLIFRFSNHERASQQHYIIPLSLWRFENVARTGLMASYCSDLLPRLLSIASSIPFLGSVRVYYCVYYPSQHPRRIPPLLAPRWMSFIKKS